MSGWTWDCFRDLVFDRVGFSDLISSGSIIIQPSSSATRGALSERELSLVEDEAEDGFMVRGLFVDLCTGLGDNRKPSTSARVFDDVLRLFDDLAVILVTGAGIVMKPSSSRAGGELSEGKTSSVIGEPLGTNGVAAELRGKCSNKVGDVLGVESNGGSDSESEPMLAEGLGQRSDSSVRSPTNSVQRWRPSTTSCSGIV